jgi:glycosyltransferase involved in cell wall biosynthesis
MNVAFLIPGDLSLPTGGYRYDREVLARLPDAGVAVRHVALPGAFPAPSDSDIAATQELMHHEARAAFLLVDGLALGALPPRALDGIGARTVALVHHPLGLEAGLPPERARWLIANESAVLARVSRVVVTSRDTAGILVRDLAVPAARIAVAEPGTDRAARATGGGDGPLALLAVGGVSPRKAFDRLANALGTMRDLDWRLTIAGPADRDADARAALDTAIQRAGIGDRVTLAGAVDGPTLDRLYAGADLFVSSSLYEGYGMALAEALARGLPLVASTGGAAADTVPDAAALKVPPGDDAALAGALRRALADAPLRRRMAEAAWAAAALLPGWDQTAAIIAAVLREASGQDEGRN